MPRQVGLVAVPCPYFLPKEPLQETGWAIPPRAPLGVLCAGECHADGTPRLADHERCNFGYARGLCKRFPADAAVDAVRFMILARDGDLIQLRYICERDHAPQGHGTLSYNLLTHEFCGAEPGSVLSAQSRAVIDIMTQP